MPLRKLGLFTTAATMVALIAVGSLNLPIEGSDLMTPIPWLHDARLTAHESLRPRAQSEHEPGGSHGIKALSVNNEIRLPTFVPVQSKNVRDLGAGKLLVASRGLADPTFAQTVILLVHYDTEGVVGLVLNRRTDLPLSRVLEGLKAANGRSDRVYLGGPLETPALFALLQSPTKLDGAEHIFGRVYLISRKALFEQILSARPGPGVFHVYLGYAGWSPAQLQQEVRVGAWFIFRADAKTVFDSDPDGLWRQMIRKTELQLAGLSLRTPTKMAGFE